MRSVLARSFFLLFLTAPPLLSADPEGKPAEDPPHFPQGLLFFIKGSVEGEIDTNKDPFEVARRVKKLKVFEQNRGSPGGVTRDDFSLDQLRLCKGLRVLSLSDVTVDEDGWKALRNLEHLRGFNLFQPRAVVDDHTLKQIGMLSQLECLFVSANSQLCKVTEDGMEHLSSLKNLRILALEGCSGAKDGLKWVREMPLTHLYLLNTKSLTSARLNALSSMQCLRRLVLSADDFSAADLASIRKKLPKVRVELTKDQDILHDDFARLSKSIVGLDELDDEDMQPKRVVERQSPLPPPTHETQGAEEAP